MASKISKNELTTCDCIFMYSSVHDRANDWDSKTQQFHSMSCKLEEQYHGPGEESGEVNCGEW